MRTRPVAPLTLPDGFHLAVTANGLLDRLEVLVNWRPIEPTFVAMFPATIGRLPLPPLLVFKLLLVADLPRPFRSGERGTGA